MDEVLFSVDQLPWGPAPPGEGFWWQTETLTAAAPDAPGGWIDPLGELPSALVASGKPAVREWLWPAMREQAAAEAAYHRIVRADPAWEVTAGLRQQGREPPPDPVEPVRPPEYDWKTFQVTAAIYSRPCARRAKADPRLAEKSGSLTDRLMRQLPGRNRVLYGRTRFDDDAFPALVHPTSTLGAWTGGGEGIPQIQHTELTQWAGGLVAHTADLARRRKKIGAAT